MEYLMAVKNFLLGLILLTCSGAFASDDPSPLQDFCVADLKAPVLVNGYVCKDPKLVIAEDFYTSGLHLERNISDSCGSGSDSISVIQVPGLNTLGISMGRVDLDSWGVIAPHYHPRASEIITVLQGTIETGFVTSNPENRLISKVLKKGDVFVIPKGLVHYQRNIGNGHAVALTAFNSQNRGVVTVGNAVFGSKPSISSDLLAKSFQVDENVIHQLQAKF
ncbi:hypothetical protein EZV62_027455 [Acer yangbiense]|uniref:Germin-like protein n=1 Tax=Acer yangbiense TaxID=1000413 RepID=A0A5C7GTQ8_9ROSI|nr:hypothetical protein EZV62_027455 [Acer yangbiense]